MGIISKIVGFFKSLGQVKEVSSRSKASCSGQGGKTKEEFIDFVKQVFGQEFQIVENYDATNIDASVTDARPYSMAFFRNGQLVLTILFTPRNKDRNKYFINAKKACEDNGIKCLSFYEHLLNENEYITSRILSNL